MSAAEAVERLYRAEWGRILATLIRLVGDFELAEESAQEAFAAALTQWQSSGVPEHPRAWVIQTARHKAIDRIRREARFQEVVSAQPSLESTPDDLAVREIPDDRLRLFFTCCHPAIALEAQIALTLRTLAGLATEEIARAFLVPPATMAQRLVRAKRKIREAGIPYCVPETGEMRERLDAVLTALYLVFNEGYAATRGAPLVRGDLCAEAIRLARTIRELMSPRPPAEATGLLALMLLHDSRSAARIDGVGELVVLEEQDRGLWDRAQIAEALPLVEESLRGGAGPFALQAAIAALHCEAARAAETDWAQIARLYERLEALQPSPVVRLNRAVSMAMSGAMPAALGLLDSIARELESYHLFHSARAALLLRAGKRSAAAECYGRALALVTNESERRFLERKLAEARE